MEDLHEVSRELVRAILQLADYVESENADPEHVVSKAEDIIEIISYFCTFRTRY